MGTVALALLFAVTGTATGMSPTHSGSVAGTFLSRNFPEKTTVSLDVLGAPVEAILRDLSKQTGTYFRASDRVKGEILIVRAKDVPLRELMEKIADADGAEWTARDDGYELTRSARMRRSQEAAEIAERAESLETALAAQRKAEPVAITRSNIRLTADANMAWHAIQTLGASTLARVESGTRIVYSTNPNPMQRRWITGLPQLVQPYIADLNRTPPAPPSGRPVHKPPPLPDAENTQRALISICRSLFQGYVVHVYLLDSAGKLITDAMAQLRMPAMREVESRLANETSRNSGKPFALFEPGEEFAQLMMNVSGQQPMKVSSALTNRILDPGKFDPLSFVAGEAIAFLSKVNSRALVASIPDSCFASAFFLRAPIGEHEIRRWLDETCFVDESKAGWIVVRPRQPIEARDLRVDREKMGAFYRKAWKNGGVRLSELGAYIASLPRRYTETISPLYGYLCMPEISQMFEPDSLGAIRVFGCLTEAQREQLEREGELSVEKLSPEAQAELTDWIFNGPAYAMAAPVYDRDYVDPTDAFPNGLSMPCVLIQTTDARDAVIPLYNGADAINLSGSPLDAESLGIELGRQDLGRAKAMGAITSFLFGRMSSLDLQFQSPKLHLSGQLRETMFDRTARTLTLGELPSAFAGAVHKVRLQYIQEHASPPEKGGSPPPSF